MSAKTAAQRAIVAVWRCPGCKAKPGEPCVTTSGQRAAMHVLRRNMALREAPAGPCPAGCGDEIITVRFERQHAGTGQFECETRTH